MIDLSMIHNMSTKDIKIIISDVEKHMEKHIYNNEICSIIETLFDDNRKSVQKFGQKLQNLKNAYIKEVHRVKNMYNFDKGFGDFKYVAGIDEVGRGPLAGPIVSAAVVLDLKFLQDEQLILNINDSKKLSIKSREELSVIIKAKAVSYNISLQDNVEIDRKGISYCNNQIFIDAVDGLNLKPELVLSDGYSIKNFNIYNEAIIKGDTKSASIACASIIAKVYRDKLMVQYSEKYPQYNFENNVGYGTRKHVEALKKYGPCEIHRMSFLKGYSRVIMILLLISSFALYKIVVTFCDIKDIKEHIGSELH